MTIILRKTLLGVCIAAALGSMTASAQPPAQAKAFGVGNPFQLEDLPPGLLRDQLVALPAVAREKAKSWLGNIQFHENDVPYMQADPEGGILFVDSFLPDLTENAAPTGAESGLVTAYTAANVFKLHSKAGAGNVVYLDFDGHVITGTAWNSYVGSSSLSALPYDLDGSPGSFNDAEAAKNRRNLATHQRGLRAV
ncbi:hypothetical protein [Thiothrix nivea]|uniref:hypothetical protein n=1 Tax=Thiothrix nivea TaxID=1031 RepID=UPI0002E1E309|nr:hypothetical protein [Thiothrix nivea]